jgi:hypothetical protein
MGWSVSRNSEPYRKLNLLDKRLRRLRGAVKAGEGPTHVSNAAEKLRLAALALIKARLALIREYPQRDLDGRESSKLRDEERRWRSLTIDAVVKEHGSAEAPE